MIGHQTTLAALSDIAMSTAAMDGAIAEIRGTDLHITHGLRLRIPRRVIDARESPQLCEALASGTPDWLDPGAISGLYLPRGSEVLCIPFPPGNVRHAAFFLYEERLELSWADRHFFQRVLSSADEAPSLPLAA
ncbi:MAG: hypothetical protein Q7T55_14795 [Solirubrobacteraceae bacterium]|nr:hypothetical protein [Solirubrobacteraceae bacterium]